MLYVYEKQFYFQIFQHPYKHLTHTAEGQLSPEVKILNKENFLICPSRKTKIISAEI
jgi:hypothetical protein